MKRILCVLLAVLIAFSALSISVSAYSINSNFISVKKDEGEVYFDSDYAEIGKALTAAVSGREDEDFLFKWYSDKKELDVFTNSYTPLECDLQSMLEVEVYDLDGEFVGRKSMFVSLLPVVYIETENRAPIITKEEYIDAELRIQGNAEFDSADCLYDGKAEIRGRGNSTWMADKKPYRIKLDSKADLFGMGKSKHWVLLSNPFDSSLIRNAVSYNFSGDLGLNYQKSVWVEVVLNGTTMGNYELCEHVRIDDTRVDITSWEDLAEDAAKAIYNDNKSTMTKDERDELIDIMSEDMSWTTSDEVTFNGVTYTVSDYFEYPDINGGYLTEVVRKAEEYTFETDRKMCISVDTPEALSDDMLDYIQGYYQAFEDALFSEDFCTLYNGKTVRYTDLIDISSFVNGFIVNEIFENYDFGRTSTWISQDIGGKLVYGPVWDMDHTVSYSTFYKWSALGVKWLGRMLSDPVFLEEIRKTYWAHRYTDIQDIIRDGGDIDSAVAMLGASAQFNDSLWVNDLSFTDNATDFKLRLQQKINWLDKTLASLSSAYSSISSSVSNINFVNSSSINLELDKATNYLLVSFKKTIPSTIKVFVDGKLASTVKTTLTSCTVALPKLKNGAVISVVAYDADMTVMFGKALSTYNEITRLEISELPEKLIYNAGEALDLTGLSLTATYSDGTEKEIKPDLAYTYVKDAIGEQFFAYGRVTQRIGQTFVVLRCQNKSVEFAISVNPRENAAEVEALISRLPSQIIGNTFVNELFLAQIAYDALSDEAKSVVSNAAKLSLLMKEFEDNAAKKTQSVVACFASNTFRANSRSAVVTVAKDEPNKIAFTTQNDSSSTYTSDSAARLSEKKVGNFTLTTIKHLISEDKNAYYKIKAVYPDNRSSDSMQISVYELQNNKHIINSFSYDKHIDSGDTLRVVVDKDISATSLRLIENGANINADIKSSGTGITLSKEFTQPGKHTLTLQYYVGSSWLDDESFDVFVHSTVDRSSLVHFVLYPEETYRNTIPVKIITDDAVDSVTVGDVSTESKSINGYKIFTAEVDITDGKQYSLKVGGKDTGTVVKAAILDHFEIDGTKIVKFLADTELAVIPEYITEIADDAFDGFEGTIRCHKDSAAHRFAQEKGISVELYEISVDKTAVKLNPSESEEIKISFSPCVPEDFELVSEYDDSVITFDGEKVTAVAPGYARLVLRSKYSAFTHTVLVTVGGAPIKADINADGKINSIDALLVLKSSVESIQLNDAERAAADVNGDGKVNSIDALIILQISTQKTTIWKYV